MPGLKPTPQRRRRPRDDDSDDNDGDDSSRISRQATPLSQASSSSKRMRLSGDHEVSTPHTDRTVDNDNDGTGNDDDDDNDEIDEPVARSVQSYSEFQPGAIVRIKLTDFVTYTSAEFFPGPKLNMVIGPNGTGKSTLVCAICLGLGWGPQHLGRAKDPGEFVKHGCREATIEIELAGPPKLRRNPVICRTIKRDGNKSTFSINGKTASRSQVLKLAQSFSIQIDNLCQFLPQDKVSEFAALSPVELLHSTQRAAAGPEMIEWHENLKKLRVEQKRLQGEQKGDRDLLSNLENRQELVRADVERMRQRAQVKRRIEMLEFSRPVPRFQDNRVAYQEAKARRDEAKGELEALKKQLEPALRAVNAKQQYYLQINSVVVHKRKKLSVAEERAVTLAKQIESHEDIMKDLDGQIEAEKKTSTRKKQDMTKAQQEINKIKRQLEEEPVDFDADLYNEQIRERKRECREIEAKAREVKGTRDTTLQELREVSDRIERAERQLANLESQSGQKEEKLKQASKDTYRAYQWLLQNGDKFEKEVFGPPIVTCSVSDPKYADIIESLFQKGDFLAFTVQTRNDFRTMQRELIGKMKLHDVHMKTCSVGLEGLRSPASHEQLRALGFEGWASEYLSGPDPVLAMLFSENRLHQTPVTLQDISDEQYAKLENSQFSSWVAGGKAYQVTRRREYGPNATSTRVRQLKPARVWTNQPVDLSAKQDILQDIEGWKDQRQQIRERIETDKKMLAELGQEYKSKDHERVKLEQEKSAKQTAYVAYRALPERLNQQTAKLKDIQAGFEVLRGRVAEIRSKQDHVALEKAEAALEYANAVAELHRLQEDLIKIEIRHIEAVSDFETMRERHEDVRNILEAKKEEVTRVMEEFRALSSQMKKLQAEAQQVAVAASTQPDLEELLQSITDYTLDRLEAEIDSEKARLALTHGGNANVIKEFEDRERQIQRLKDKLSTFQESMSDVDHAIKEIRDNWEPKLDALVQRISDAFSDSFARIGCAGQVTVDKVENPPGLNGEPGGSDFDQWSIQIQVKFREHEQLSVLDSHRQSGGERAVSTIFYLMALQSLSASPFRVVDEINQGMDPRNERMVHERMVDIACAPSNAIDTSEDNVGGRGGSQYFLITPKLLSGLVYKPGMRVLCIVSGEHVPDDYHEIDFGSAIRRMKAIAGPKSSVSAGGSRHQSRIRTVNVQS